MGKDEFADAGVVLDDLLLHSLHLFCDLGDCVSKDCEEFQSDAVQLAEIVREVVEVGLAVLLLLP